MELEHPDFVCIANESWLDAGIYYEHRSVTRDPLVELDKLPDDESRKEGEQLLRTVLKRYTPILYEGVLRAEQRGHEVQFCFGRGGSVNDSFAELALLYLGDVPLVWFRLTDEWQAVSIASWDSSDSYFAKWDSDPMRWWGFVTGADSDPLAGLTAWGGMCPAPGLH